MHKEDIGEDRVQNKKLHKEKEQPPLSCLNCEAAALPGYNYCGVCSQKLKSSKVNVASLMKEFIMGFFNLDSRLFQTLGKIIIPGKLTEKYMAGKRKSYINPARLFLFSMIFFFAISNYAFKRQKLEIGGMEHLKEYAAQKKQVIAFDSLIAKYPIDTLTADTLRKTLFNKTTDSFQDSISLGEAESFVQMGGFDNKKFYIGDIASMDEEEFVNHYEITEYFPRLLTKQVLRVNRNPEAVSSFMIGNMLWAVVLSVLFLAFIMKLLYWRQKRFFVEHLILQMHIHSFLFILIGILILAYIFKLIPGPMAGTVGSLLSLPFIYFSFKKYYQQGYFKTLIKTIFIGFSYMFIATFCSVIIILISMVVF